MVFRFAAILPVNRWVAFRQRGSHPKGSVVQVRANQPLKMVFPGASARGPPAWDDALDYVASAEELGKNLGDDLAEGKPTLPLIYAMEKGTDAERSMIRGAIEAGGLDRLDEIQAVVESTGALQYTAARAQEAADVAIGALSVIPDSDYKQALIALAEFSVRRRS